MCDICEDQEEYFDFEQIGQYLGHGEYKELVTHYCLRCAIEAEFVCCENDCEGVCIKDGEEIE